MKQLILLFFMLMSTSVFAQNESLIEQLKADDVLEITYTSQGCFSTTTETIVIKNNNNQLFSNFTGLNAEVKQVALSQNQIDAFVDFEQKLSLFKNNMGLCTNTKTYHVKLNGKLLSSKIDSSCSWNGFAELKNQFFLLN